MGSVWESLPNMKLKIGSIMREGGGGVGGRKKTLKVFFSFSICISKDPELPKTNVFIKEKKKLVEEHFQYFMKISGKINVFSGYPCKNVSNIFAYFSVSEYSASFSL